MMKLFTVLALLLPLAAPGDVILGRVVGVSDGDTVKILTPEKREERIRFQGIDAPEKKQDFGSRAKQHLSGLVFGKDVRVEFRKRDRYGRILGKVLREGRDVNLAVLEAGFAWYYRHFSKELSPGDRKFYAEAEDRARRAKAGLWAGKTPVPPWDFRRKERGARRQLRWNR